MKTLAKSDKQMVDVVACARRAVARLRPAAELRDDLTQQAIVLGFEILQRFEPRLGPDEPPAHVQAERYLAVALQRSLWAYARHLRTTLPVPERDRRLARAYGRLVASHGSLTLAEAAAMLGVPPKRLASALAASERTLSLDQPAAADANDAPTLSAQLATDEPDPEALSIAALDDAHALIRRDALRPITRDVQRTAQRPHPRQKRAQLQRRVLYSLIDRLPRGDAEVIRLAFALPRKELDHLRSCRTYGCRRDDGHAHTPREIARWLQVDDHALGQRLERGLDRLGDLLGGRDAAILLYAVSDQALAASATPRVGLIRS